MRLHPRLDDVVGVAHLRDYPRLKRGHERDEADQVVGSPPCKRRLRGRRPPPALSLRQPPHGRGDACRRSAAAGARVRHSRRRRAAVEEGWPQRGARPVPPIHQRASRPPRRTRQEQLGRRCCLARLPLFRLPTVPSSPPVSSPLLPSPPLSHPLPPLLPSPTDRRACTSDRLSAARLRRSRSRSGREYAALSTPTRYGWTLDR